jgi:hypothetical protein
MKQTCKSINQKGETNMYYVVVGVVLALAIFCVVKYFHDQDNGAVIQLPKVEVH